jgi:hypothetical protein
LTAYLPRGADHNPAPGPAEIAADNSNEDRTMTTKKESTPDTGALEFPVAFGRLQATGEWIWVCECPRCQPLPLAEKMHGPFRTLRKAERDFEAAALKSTEGWTGTHQ